MWAERVMEGGGGGGVGPWAGLSTSRQDISGSLVWAISEMLALYEATRQSDWECTPHSFFQLK
jgi:hypothetical protein